MLRQPKAVVVVKAVMIVVVLVVVMVTRDGTTGRTKDQLMIDYRRLTLLALVLVPDPHALALPPLLLALVPVRTSIVWREELLHDEHELFC